TLSAVDNPASSHAGVDKTYYVVLSGADLAPAKGNAAWLTYSSAVTLHNGERIAYYSDDAASPTSTNTSNSHGYAQVDQQAPTTRLAAFKFALHDALPIFTLSAVDNPASSHAGVDKTYYVVLSGADLAPAKGNAAWLTYSSAVTLHNGERIAYYSD